MATCEIEAKFRVHPPFTVPDLTGDRIGVARVDRQPAKELAAVYWDTADLRLAREGITLRYRSGEGEGDGWHLKLPILEAAVPDASTGARDEIHAAGDNGEIPPSMRDLVTAHVRSAILGPVATLVTTRTSYVLVGSDEQPVAELTDDLVSVVDQGHVAGRFREIEVEDRGGGLEVLERVGDALRTAGAVGGEFLPKVVRALGPQATADPDPPLPDRVKRGDPARLAVRAVLRSYVRNFIQRDVAVRRGEDDAVHQMRVAARRLRSALKTFLPLVDAEWAQSLRRELAWAADSLGGARDNEVLLERLHRDLDTLPPELVIGPVRARIDQRVGGDLTAGANAAVEALRTERYVALVDRLVEAAREPMTSDAADAPVGAVIPPLVGAAWARLAKGARRVRRPDAADRDWHRTRIAAKQTRYAAEAVVPFFGKPAKTLAQQAEHVQDLLGEHQDAVIAGEVIRRMATAPRAGTIAFTLGLLYAMQQDAIERSRREFPDAWTRASKSKYRKWLRN